MSYGGTPTTSIALRQVNADYHTEERQSERLMTVEGDHAGDEEDGTMAFTGNDISARLQISSKLPSLLNENKTMTSKPIIAGSINESFGYDNEKQADEYDPMMMKYLEKAAGELGDMDDASRMRRN